MLALFCFVLKLEDPGDVPAVEWAFYTYTLVRCLILLYELIAFDLPKH